MTQGKANLQGGGNRFLSAFGEPVIGGHESEFARGEIADPVAVHRQLHGLRRWRHAPTFLLQLAERRRVNRLDLGNDDIRLVPLDRRSEGLAVEHRKDLAGVRHLHGGCVCVAVARNDPAAETLRCDREFAAELAGAKQHQGGGEHGRAIAALGMLG